MGSKTANQLAGLSPAEQRELLQRLLKEKAEKDKSQVKKAPLSFAQERLWFLYQLEPDSAAYNLRTAVHLSGNLQIPALTQSLQDVVQRHEALRTRFVVVQDQPMQHIAPSLSIPLPIVDVDEANVEGFAEVEVQRPFSLSDGPLIRAKLLRVSPTDHILLITMHHIISDGWSIGLLIRELTQLYEANVSSGGRQFPQRELPQIPVQYAEFAAWQRQWLQGDVLEKQMQYWQQKLANSQTVLDLPTDFPRPPRQTDAGTRLPFQADAGTAAALHTLCQAEGVTMFMLLLAAFNALLYRYTQQTDLLIGTPVAGRQRRQLEGVIGLFVNTLVLRTNLSGNPTFRELLQQVSQTAKEAYDHQDIPFERLVETLQPVRDPSRSPLFQVMLVLQNAPMDALQLADLQLTQLRPNKGTSQFDMTLMMWDDDEAVRGYLEYRTDLFTAETMTRFLVHFGELLTSIVANPDAPIAQLTLLTEAESRQMTQTWNDTAVSYPHTLCIHQYISQQAAKTPNHVALDFAGEQVTYQELDQRSNQLAHCLIAAGVQPDTMVALCMERSLDMIVGILGVMKAGGAYVPIDASYPAQRIHYIMEDTQALLLLSQSHLLPQLPPHQAQVICLDTLDTAVYPTHDPETAVTPDNLAYIIYTSGSTGRPKGVLVPHRGLLNVIKADHLTYQLTPQDRVLQFASLSFDASVYDILNALSVGATLQLATQQEILPGPDLLHLLQEKEITMATLMPSVLAALPDAPLPALRTLTVAGEPCSAALVERWGHNRRFFNLYGPTEASIWCSAALCTPGQLQAPAIGKPISNTQLYVLDPFLQPVPIGVVGELHIGGAGITRGYHNRPGLTAARFIPDPFGAAPGARLYKTGDLARLRANGDLEFVGRADHQVKIRGYRIELGEISHALVQHDAVQEAAVIVREDKPQQKRIVAYVIPKEAVTAVTLRNHLKNSLPDYMIPAAFVMMDTFPQTHSHKLNTAALPAPEAQAQQHEYIAPRNQTETELAQLWQALLGQPTVSIHDSFFDIGGHSLLVTQLASRIRSQFAVEFPLRDLFDVTTIAAQAERIAEMQGQESGRQLPTIQRRPRPEHLPLSFGQQRLWMLEQLTPGLSTYHIPAALRINGRINRHALQTALDAIIDRHEPLRTNFITHDGSPVQQIAAARTVTINFIDLTSHAEPEAAAETALRQAATRPFNLAYDPLLRVYLVQTAAEEHILLLVMHHIISDGWSMGILIRELTTLYQAFAHAEPNPLSPLPLHYADFVLWHQAWLQDGILQNQLDYWQQQLKDAPSVLNLTVARPRPAIQTFTGAQKQFTLPDTLAQSVRNLSQQHGVTLFMTLLAAFQTLLYRYSEQDDILVGAPIANRHFAETENLIGFFVNTLVFRGRLQADLSFAELLQQVRETVLAAQTNQDLPFEKLVEVLSPQRNLSHSPLFQVMFVLQSDMDTAVSLPNLQISPLSLPGTAAKFDLMLVISEQQGALRGTLEYNTDLFSETTIHNMKGHFLTLLAAIGRRPQQQIGRLPMLTPAEKTQIIQTWNECSAAYPHQTLHQRFQEQAAKHETAVAVVCADTQLTYGELDAQTNRLARHLRTLGVQRGTLVGISTVESVERVVAVLATLKAGGAYVPLDPAYPQERLAFMLADTQTPVLITQSDLLPQLPPHDAATVCMDKLDLSPYSAAALDLPVQPNDLAYVIYTSGTTGRPKGICCAHAGVQNLLANFNQWQPLHVGHNNAWWTSFNFDVSVYELFVPLICGATLHIVPPEVRLDTRAFAKWMVTQQIHSAYIPPFMLAPLLALWQAGDFVPPLQRLLVGVEPIPEETLAQMRQAVPGLILINGYGPTEATICATLYPVPMQAKSDGHAPMGRPTQNLDLYVLDAQMQPVAVGVPGELYIGGIGLAHGYLRRPALTATQFVPNPFSNAEGARLYRTGDLVRYLPDGNLLFVGRGDFQVKIRGYRVELEEIRQLLIAHEGVRDTAVIVREDKPQPPRLIAYVIPHPGFGTTTGELQAYLKQRLPDYMVPSAIVLLDTLPQTPNGKLDKDALPLPTTQRIVEIAYQPPQTGTQQKIAAIMEEMLQIEQVGIQDNFFDLGAHSLLLIQAHAKLQQTFQRDIAVIDLFRYATIESLAAYLSQDEDKKQQDTANEIQQREQKRRAAMKQARRRTNRNAR